jgi:hypothetical protein
MFRRQSRTPADATLAAEFESRLSARRRAAEDSLKRSLCRSRLDGVRFQSDAVRRNVTDMLQRVHALWCRWRESRRQYQLERALYKAGGNPTGAFGPAEHAQGVNFASGVDAPRIETPKSKAPGPSAE